MSRQGVLALHGFTATPECLESLTAPLRKKGFEVSAPLLVGHGSTAQALSQTKWQDWYQGVAGEFEKLQKLCSDVSVVGLSLGGLLSLKLATAYPVRRLALLATPLFLSGFLAKYVLPVLGNTFLKEIYPYQPKLAGPAINDPVGRAQFKSYTKMPIRSIMEIVRLQKDLASRLPSITVPTLILHSPHDTTAPYANMEFLKSKLGSPEIKTISLELSDHVLTMDYEKEKVAHEVAQFFAP